MTNLLDGLGIGLMDDACDPECPFCEGGQPSKRGFKTKHGALKDERQLGKNLGSDKEVKSDPEVGPVFPLPGGGDVHKGWVVRAGVMEEFEVLIGPTPHHLIPGNASMQPSSLEQWTCESKGKVIEDIGYNIDGAQNGIWLPHLPNIHWTSYFDKASKTRYCDVFGKWSALGVARKAGVGYLVMSETWLQMHYTDHDDPYAHVDNETNYDDEVKERCNLLGDMMTSHFATSAKCKNKDEASGKYFPPYGLVQRINAISSRFRHRISGKPTWWESWVSPLAQDFTDALMRDEIALKMQLVIQRK